MLARWKHHQEVLDEIGRDPDRKDEYQTICGLGQSWLIERDGQNVVLSPDSSERDTRAWVFWDPVGGPLGTLIGVDRYGKVASNEFDLAELRPRRKDS